jgi:hypothetical protein
MRNFLVTVNDHDELGGDFEVPALCLASAWNRAAKQLRHRGMETCSLTVSDGNKVLTGEILA